MYPNMNKYNINILKFWKFILKTSDIETSEQASMGVQLEISQMSITLTSSSLTSARSKGSITVISSDFWMISFKIVPHVWSEKDFLEQY